jgi:hypothetical protein
MASRSRALGRHSIRSKLIAALTPLLLVLAAAVAFEVGGALREVEEVRHQTDLVEAALGPLGLLNALESERNAASIYLLGLQDAVTLEVEDNAEARRITDEAAAQLRAQLGRLDAPLRERYVEALEGFERLEETRRVVDEYAGPFDLTNIDLPTGVFAEYTTVAEHVYAANHQVAGAIDDASIRRGAQLALLSTNQTDLIAQLIREMLLAGHAGDMDGVNDSGEIRNVASLLTRLRTNEEQLGAAGAGEFRVFVEELLAADEVRVFPGVVEETLRTSVVDIGAALGAATGRTEDSAYTVFREGLSERLRAEAAEREATAVERARWLAVLAVAATVLALAVALLVARSIVRSLGDLTRQATALAHRRLPDAVRGILETPLGQDVAVPAIEPIRVRAHDESADVAAALTSVQETAVGLAVEQAMLRRNSADSFLNMGRRYQNLLARQLEFITDLETRETDTDFLGKLFHLDHLATRMRRNAESLLVLAGVETPRRWATPVPISRVVRAAVGEVEDFTRVSVRSLTPVTVNGAAASDLAHLLAELVENALANSPTHEPVAIRGARTGVGYRLAVVDAGWGMTALDRERANRRLSGDEPVTVAPSRALGHYVAGRLAARHGVIVRLEPTASGGVAALVDLPPGLAAPATPDAVTPVAPPRRLLAPAGRGDVPPGRR